MIMLWIAYLLTVNICKAGKILCKFIIFFGKVINPSGFLENIIRYYILLKKREEKKEKKG